MNKKKFKGSPIHASLHNTTLTWAAFENNPLIDWPMNFIQEWGALGELNNKGVVANSLGSFFYFILFHVHFLPVIYLEILNSRIKWWKRLSAHIIQSIERLRFTSTPNGKREFVPRDQVFPLFFVYCLLLLHKNK